VPELNGFEIVVGVLGGLALFLFGMVQMSDALKLVAGGGLKRLLGYLTRNRFAGAATGAVVTAVVQSSSVTTVLVVGFISAGLMSLGQSIAVIMGANIGTTLTVQIIAFKVTRYALILVAVGFAVMFLSRREKWRFYGTAIMGLGLIFFGMDLMSQATGPLRDYEPFTHVMGHIESPLVGVLAAALVTAVIQSSAATSGMIIILASQGFITLEGGIALVFGANIGTCVTALLAAIGKPREAVQAALVHVLFNIVGVLIWIGLIDQLAEATRFVSPSYPSLTGLERLAAETPREIANAHTIFNIANTLLLIGFTRPFAWVMNKLLPIRREDSSIVKPRYLDDNLLAAPALALDRVRMELGRIGKYVVDMIDEVPRSMISGEREELERLRAMDEQVDTLHAGIVTYLGALSTQGLTPAQSDTVTKYLAIANYIESIGDMVETNIYDAGIERIGSQVEISEPTLNVLRALHRKVQWSVEQSIRALLHEDRALARTVIAAKEDVNGLVDDAERHLMFRLGAEEPHRLSSFRVESEIVEHLKRVYYFAKRIAKTCT